MMDRSDTFETNTSEFPILGDNESPVTPEGHPSMRNSSHRLSPSGSKRKLAHSPLSQTQSSSSSLAASTASNSLTDRLTMMNIPTQELKGSVFYGWLWKRGQSFKTWKKRFFLLNGAALTYYTKCCVIASDVLGGGTPQILDLPVRGGLRVAKAELTDLTSFGLKVTSSSGRVLYVQAGDQESREQWLKVLKEAPTMRGEMMGAVPLRRTMASDLSTQRSYQTESSSPYMNTMAMSVLSSEDEDDTQDCDMQGYLYVRAGLLPTWKKRFMMLTDGHLTIRRSRMQRTSDPHDDKPFEVISAVTWSGHAHGLCIRLENKKELYVYAGHDADASMWLDALKSC
ncbi:hypothetical protein PHMEG_00018904 [Phytophthora megakarya]|uniref:PH domain-containing protein n=1 Tax=Phytophthora megakarya TaxID=4795 RepID=A0A225VSV9_9STRA|nr:hypothetical protein PHMEG_00018904 [Phytophthora megakarya]